MSEGLRLSQLVCSRLCHDLVGAAGAVNAGLEILAEMGALDDKALELATNSGHELTRRLTFYRVSLGAGGAGDGGAETTTLKKLADDFMSAGSVQLDWPDLGDGVRKMPPALGKLLLNLVMIGSECLPRGGVVGVRIAEIDGGIGLAVSAEGPGAGLREDLAKALTPGIPIEELDSRCIQGMITQLLVVEAGCELEVAAEGDAVRFAAVAR